MIPFLATIEQQFHPIGINVLDDKAQKSLTYLKTNDLPTRKNEIWKYSPLSKFLKTELNRATTVSKIEKSFQSEELLQTIEINHNETLNKEIFEQIGFEVIHLDQKTDKKYLEILSDENFFKDDILSHLSRSEFQRAWILKPKKGISFKKPLHLKHLFSGDKQLFNFQILFDIPKMTSLEIIESFSSSGSGNLINYKSHTLLQESSQFEHVILQDLSLNDHFTLQINNTNCAHSNYNNIIITKGASFSRSNLFHNLVESNAVVHAHGLYLLDQKQHHDTMSFIKHSAPHTYSHQLYKGVMNESARGVFTGRVRVEKDAQKIDAHQLNKNLLLSPKAHANSRPQMEIYADDVKCAHGSTTGQISAAELFYFESRGIEPTRAKKLLAQAYANDVLLKINQKLIRDFVQENLGQLELL